MINSLYNNTEYNRKVFYLINMTIAEIETKCTPLMYFTVLNVCRASVSGRMDVIYVRFLLPYAEKFDPGRMTYVQLLSVMSA